MSNNAPVFVDPTPQLDEKDEEILVLIEENARLRDALSKIVTLACAGAGDNGADRAYAKCADIAERALEGK